MKRVAVAAVALVAVPATVAVARDEAPKITKNGAGAVKLGASYDKLRADGRVGKLIKGCELAGKGQRSARLAGPLKGFVDLTTTDPRKVRTIIITGGAARAKGVRVGDSVADLEAAFPRAEPTEQFGITLYRVPKRYVLAVDGGKVVRIGIPYIPFCE